MPPVDVTTLDLLTLPQVLVYLHQMGRPMGRGKLGQEIASGRLPVLVDHLHLDRLRNPRYLIERAAVDRWLRASLTPLRVASLAS
jgi:hypothetical protein